MNAMKELCFVFFIYFLCYFKPIENVGINPDPQQKPCTPGQTYKKACNNCVCLPNQSLVCSKMACLSDSYADTLRLLHGNRTKRDVCVPGGIKKTACKLCFCDSYGKTSVCVDDLCGEMPKTENKHASSVFDIINAINKKSAFVYPSLPNRISDCTPGNVYRVDCNTCLCLFNGDLVCDNSLCVDYDQINVWAAKDLNGKQCNTTDALKGNSKCIKCICKNDKLNCNSISNCLPETKRYNLHEGISRSSEKQCEEGTIYKYDCNKCICQGNSLRCTLKTCLTKSQVKLVEEILSKVAESPSEDKSETCKNK